MRSHKGHRGQCQKRWLFGQILDGLLFLIFHSQFTREGYTPQLPNSPRYVSSFVNERQAKSKAGRISRKTCIFWIWGSDPWNLVKKKVVENGYYGLGNESAINSVVKSKP